jgi:hypothetical protein
VGVRRRGARKPGRLTREPSSYLLGFSHSTLKFWMSAVGSRERLEPPPPALELMREAKLDWREGVSLVPESTAVPTPRSARIRGRGASIALCSLGQVAPPPLTPVPLPLSLPPVPEPEKKQCSARAGNVVTSCVDAC